MKKRLLSLCLAFVMVLGMMPVTAMAEAAGVPVDNNVIDVVDTAVGNKTITKLMVDKIVISGADVVSATQDETEITVILSADTEPGTTITPDFIFTTTQTTTNEAEKKTDGTCTLGADGSGTTTVDVRQKKKSGKIYTTTFTINFKREGQAEVSFDTNLDEKQETYTQGTEADTLSASATYSANTEATVTYQWYSNTEKNNTNGKAIDGANSTSFTPPTDTVGVTYYYVVASCNGVSATSKLANIKVIAPVVEFTNNLDAHGLTEEITAYKGETVSLEVEAHYTGVNNGSVSYQWYSNTTGSAAPSTDIPTGENGTSFTPPTDTVGEKYYYAVASYKDATDDSKNASAESQVAKVTVEDPVRKVANNVVDIADKLIYKLNARYARATGITISGENVTVKSATEGSGTNGTVVNIVLNSTTPANAVIGVEFTTSTDSNSTSVSVDGNDSVTLVNGEAQLTMTLSARGNSSTYTLNFTVAEPDTVPPKVVMESDTAETYSGVALALDVRDYFENATTYWLLAAGEEGSEGTLEPLTGSTYTFMSTEIGEYELKFAAKNEFGTSDYVTITVSVSEIQSGALLNIETGNGSVDYVLFTDGKGEKIDGLTAVLEEEIDKVRNIKVSAPHSVGCDGTIKAEFVLTQSNGYPKFSTVNAATGHNDTKVYTTTLEDGAGTVVMYLYDSTPTALQNYITYNIIYTVANTAPVLAEEQASTGTASISADESYTLDLDGIFTDPDGDEITGWKVSVDGAAAVAADVNSENEYIYRTNAPGEHTLVFYAVDNFNAVSTATYTVTLDVENSAETYEVTVTVPAGIEPTFYYSENAESETELDADLDGNVYTVTVPKNISGIAWRANGMGMYAEISAENNELEIFKTDFKVMAGETEDGAGTIVVKYGDKTAIGNGKSYLLLSTGSYTVTITPSSGYSDERRETVYTDQAAVSGVKELQLDVRETAITIPTGGTLFIGEASSVQGITPEEIEPKRKDGNTYYYILKNDKAYEFRVDIKDNPDAVPYVGTFKKTEDFSLEITEEQVLAGTNGRKTVEREIVPYTEGNYLLGSANTGDLCLNVNAQGYLKLAEGGSYQLHPMRQWWGANGTWFITDGTGLSYYFVEPDYHYTVVNENGITDNDVIEIGEDGLITAKNKGTAIVMVTYDAMTLDHRPAIANLNHDPNGFYGAIWPENTGVFVVTVGAEDSEFDLNMIINEDMPLDKKTGGSALDSELDVIYFIGDEGEYTFKPAEGVTVSVANPTISNSVLGFTGFKGEDENENEDKYVTTDTDGNVTVYLTEGRNIVKLEKDGKAEYQVITAKSVKVTVNGDPLETAVVMPGEEVSIVFDTLYNPNNRMQKFNTDAAVVYSSVSGYSGKSAGNSRGPYGYYYFAATSDKQTVAHFNNANTDGSQYSNSTIDLGAPLTVPENFTEEYFVLSDGSFNVGGFSHYLFGEHRNVTTTPPTSLSSNINTYLGRLPDISIPVATPTSIAVTTQPTKTEYNIGDVFDPTGMVVTASYAGTDVTRPVTGYTYDTTAFTEAGEKAVTITYGQLTTTVTVTVNDITLEKIEATTAPSKTLYYIGDHFDPTGMVITATYSNGSTREITDYTYAPDVIAKDTTAVTVTYGSKSVDVPVSVSLVERLEITTQPTKKNYTEGERFDSSGMVVKAFYTDGSSFETDEYDWSPAGQLSPSDTTVTVTYNGSEGAANLQPATVSITVEKKQEESKPEQIKFIMVYMTFVNRGSIVVQDAPVVIYDEDKDGIYSIGDAFLALHRDYYPGGESGYAEISGNGVSGWVSKFWGSGDGTFTYAHNHSWASSTNNSIYDGDSIAAINGVDSEFYSDLYTWFESSSYSALTEQDETFTVNGLNLMGSSASYDALHPPVGADVTVYRSGSEVSGMGTTVDEDGRFSLYFEETGTYTVKISGTAAWGNYTDAPVAPCTCTVYVYENPTPEKKPEEKPNETPADTVTPEIEADANGEARVEIGTDAVADALEQAVSEGKDSVVVTPVVKGESSVVTVELPKDAVDNITENSDMNLKVETPAASVTISNAGLAELTSQKDGSMSVSVETVKDENGDSTGEIRINVAVDNESVANVSGGIAVTVLVEEVSPGSVLVVVHSDGTETVVKKSIVAENGVTALLNGSAAVKVVDNSKKFVDVEPEIWYADGVDFVSSRELYNGVGNDRFDPAGDMTRGMLVTVLHRLEDEMEHNYEGTFHDVEEDNWYTDAIHWAADHNIVGGYGNGYFGTHDNITREQMVTMVFRYLNWLGMDTTARGDLSFFADNTEISDWAVEAMEWGIGVGIIDGVGNALVDPGSNATRAQVAVFMQRVIGQMAK